MESNDKEVFWAMAKAYLILIIAISLILALAVNYPTGKGYKIEIIENHEYLRFPNIRGDTYEHNPECKQCKKIKNTK